MIKTNVKRIAVTQESIHTVTQESIHVRMTEIDHHAKRVQERRVSTMKILNLIEENQVEETKRIVNYKKSISGMTQKHTIANKV